MHTMRVGVCISLVVEQYYCSCVMHTICVGLYISLVVGQLFLCNVHNMCGSVHLISNFNTHNVCKCVHCSGSWTFVALSMYAMCVCVCISLVVGQYLFLCNAHNVCICVHLISSRTIVPV